jgi:hypothetical protein
MITRFALQAPTTRFKTFNFQAPNLAKALASPLHAVPKPPQRPTLAPFQRARLRAKIATITCSDPWTELATTAAESHGIHAHIESIPSQLALRGIYPPKPDPGPDRLPRVGAVRMRRCDGCGRIVPPNNVASFKLVRLCDDCRIEPETDPDIAADRPDSIRDSARAPGAQFGTLMEGPIADDTQRDAVRDQLNQLGLTDPEIMAMALTHAGYSTRRVADLGRWSQTYVRKLLNSAARKLRRSGLAVPKAPDHGTTSRTVNMDPVKLDCMSDRVR